MSEYSHPGPQVLRVDVAQMGRGRRDIFTVKHHQTRQQNHQLVVVANLIQKEKRQHELHFDTWQAGKKEA